MLSPSHPCGICASTLVVGATLALAAPYMSSLELGVGATLAHAFPSLWCMRPLFPWWLGIACKCALLFLPHSYRLSWVSVQRLLTPSHPRGVCAPCMLSPIYVIACAVGWLGALFLLTSPCGVDGPSCIRIPVYCLSVSGWLAFVHCPPYLVVHAAHTHVSPSPHNHSSLSRALNFPVSGKFGLTAPHLDPGRHTVHSQGRLGRKLLTGPC